MFLSSYIRNQCMKILTNTKLNGFGSHSTSTVADDAVVPPFIGFLHTGDCQCSTVRPLCITRLPLLTPIFLLNWPPLPLVFQRFCSSGLDSERDGGSWDNFLQAFGLASDFGWFTYRQTNIMWLTHELRGAYHSKLTKLCMKLRYEIFSGLHLLHCGIPLKLCLLLLFLSFLQLTP